MKLGGRKEALEQLNNVLEIFPENVEANALMEEIKK